jgi:hypothetical protein
MWEELDKLPDWVGTAPQWGLFIVFAIAVIKTSPQWLTTWSALRLAKSNRNSSRIKDLEEQVRVCREECDRDRRNFRIEIEGLRKQRNTEQLAIMRAIVRMSSDPEVKRQLELLEGIEISFSGADNEQS